MNRDELGTLARKLGTPIDFEELVQAGVLRRKSKLRFEVLDMDRLPEHARLQANGATFENGKPPVLHFSGSNKSAQKTYEKGTGKKSRR